jgi:MFS family permease
MNSGDAGAGRFFWGLLACGVLFAWYSSGLLPPLVASHFNAAGTATGFLPRSVYRFAAVAMVLLPPLMLAFMPAWSLRNPRARINIPNSGYWLTPERRPETVQIIASECRGYGQMLMLFMCYVQWLVVRANQQPQPSLNSGWFLAGLVVFLGLTARWAGRFINRFRPEADE